MIKWIESGICLNWVVLYENTYGGLWGKVENRRVQRSKKEIGRKITVKLDAGKTKTRQNIESKKSILTKTLQKELVAGDS